MNDSHDLTTANSKFRILKMIRDLDWSREQNMALVLQAITNLEIAARAHTQEGLKLAELACFATIEFQNTRTQENFNVLLQAYNSIANQAKKTLPSTTAAITNVLFTASENKTLSDDEDFDLENYIDTEEGEYNPLADAFNDHLDMLDEMNELSVIEKNINLDWMAEPVAPVTPVVTIPEFWEYVGFENFAIDKKLETKNSDLWDKSSFFDSALIKFPKKQKSLLGMEPRTALMLGAALAAITALAISVLAPFLVPTVAAVIGGTALVHSMIVAGTIGVSIGSVTALANKMVKNLKQLFKREPVVIVEKEKNHAQKQKTVTVKTVANIAPEAAAVIHSDNIHENPSVEQKVNPKAVVAATVSQSTQALFNRNSNKLRTEPQALLVPKRMRVR